MNELCALRNTYFPNHLHHLQILSRSRTLFPKGPKCIIQSGSTLLLARAVSIFLKGVYLEVGHPWKFSPWMFSRLAMTSSFSQLGQ